MCRLQRADRRGSGDRKPLAHLLSELKRAVAASVALNSPGIKAEKRPVLFCSCLTYQRGPEAQTTQLDFTTISAVWVMGQVTCASSPRVSKMLLTGLMSQK